ncbi:MAG: sugar phosphate isomerase/epimerase [Alphaproteobacteria bacterium]|jgi:sugar phosphate isomerase/epimerase|nr:sugar phosphate isomerase/epimerase [Alphaproteobacteria bacterium]
MKTGGSTFSFMWLEPAAVALRRMAAIGLNDFDVLLVPGHLWFDLDANSRRALRRALDADGLRLDSLNLPAIDLNLASVVPQVRDHAVATYVQAIELAAELGAGAVVVVPGRVSALLPPPRAETIARLTDAAGILLRRAGQLGCKLYFELHPQTPLPTTDLLAPWVSSLGSADALIAYDVANAVFVGEDPVAAIAAHAASIGQYHLSDTTRTNWRHDPFGRGEVPLPAVMDQIRKSGCTGTAILEIISADPLTDMGEALAMMSVDEPATSGGQVMFRPA